MWRRPPPDTDAETTGTTDAAVLTIVTSPPDAAVKVDGNAVSRAARENLELDPGEHHVEATREGYRVWRSDVTLEPGQRRRLAIALERRQGRLAVISSPAGARVSVDGVDRGVTPVESLPVKPGTLKVRVERSGYESEDREVQVADGAEGRVEVTLEERKPVAHSSVQRKKKAFLSVNTTPWSNVTLDGRHIGNTPVLGREISPGRHVLILTNPVRSLTKRLVFVVKPGEHKRVTESLRE